MNEQMYIQYNPQIHENIALHWFKEVHFLLRQPQWLVKDITWQEYFQHCKVQPDNCFDIMQLTGIYDNAMRESVCRCSTATVALW